MTQKSGGSDIGTNPIPSQKHWVQTERAAHEAWSRLCSKKPRAAALLHTLIARMGEQNAIVMSQALMAKLLDVNPRTVQRALADLESSAWIQRVTIGRGRECAIVINDRVAWGQRRADLPRLSQFSAQVIADADEQEPESIEQQPLLRRIPTLYPGEEALPTGPGEDPPSQPSLDGLEPVVYRDNAGHLYEHDPQTGELQQRIEDPAPASEAAAKKKSASKKK